MNTIVVAPHPDDEVLGAGGTLLRRKSEGSKVGWLIITNIESSAGWSEHLVQKRKNEIIQTSKFFGFDSVFQLGFPAAQLDRVPLADLVNAISEVFKSFQPEEIFIPHLSDVHTDHRIVSNAVISCTKWFRHSYIRRILAYETLSETDFNLNPRDSFCPNVFINIESELEEKCNAMSIYSSEVGVFPFPRSHEAIRALAALRGSTAGFKAAEAFELLRERLI